MSTTPAQFIAESFSPRNVTPNIATNNRQFIDRRNMRCIAQLQRPKIGKP